MKNLNPWIAIPVTIATIGGGVVGALIMELSCAPGSCVPASIGVGVVSAALAFFGVGVVVVLAARSMAEWRHNTASGAPQPAPEGDPEPPTC